ncbi:hypothetical protein Clacol_010178 [Clathrus columnatus]|uniref:RING-type domain-containing protein n=1 Tax=Clathrus columnatus TaxID=1419009 RepID=A0AAV5AN71_9AGAM|nr:hypothetical protein Clacol_010178 [Clathrus columnatus]
MLIECLLSLKRKFFNIAEECDGEENDTCYDTRIPRKNLRVEGPASIHETMTPKLAACDAGHGKEENLPQETVKEEETIEELEARVKESEERIVRDKKKAEQVATKLKKVKEEDMVCMVCRDTVYNPQVLQCGHSACYGCLRNWWTHPLAEYDGVEIIDTEAEADINEENVVRDQANLEAEDVAPPEEPRLRPRHQFPSAVNRKKLCPYCNEVVTRRPAPNFQLRDIGETLTKDLAPLPPHVQAQRKARLTRRSDLWHGIFPPENEQLRPISLSRLDPEPDSPPPPHPDPILNHFAQARYRRAEEEAAAWRERLHAQAYENGRIIGRMEVQARWDRAEARRAAAEDHRQRERRGLTLAIPSPVVPQEASGNAGDVQLPQDPFPDRPVGDALQPPLDDPAAM